MIFAHRHEEVAVLRVAARAEQLTVEIPHDASNVGVQFVFDLGLDEWKTILRRKDDVKITAE